MDTEYGPEREQEEYSFLQEKIKDEGSVLRRILKKLCKWLTVALIAGFVIWVLLDVVDDVKALLNGNREPYVGIVGEMVTEDIAEQYGVPVGLYITGVEKDSPAMKAGIQSGDVITMAGDTELTSMEIYEEALREFEVGQNVIFEGKRYGLEEYVDITFTVIIGIQE